MRRALLLAAALLAAAPLPARAWRLFGEPSDGKIRPVQALNDDGKPRAVIAALTPDFLQTLRGTDLRQAYVLLGDNYDRIGRPDQALGAYQLGVGLFPRNVDLLTRLGGLLHRNGMDERAKTLFQRALLYEPRHWGAHLGLAEIDRRFGFLDRAADHYEIALEAPAVVKRTPVWIDYAEVLLKLREDKTAELALRRAIALDPNDADARVDLAFVRRAQGDYDEAFLQLDAASALGAGVGATRAKALFLLEDGRPDDAAAAAREVLAAVPGDAAAEWTLARAAMARGRVAEAEKALSAVRDASEDGFAGRAAKVLLARLKSPGASGAAADAR
jgi:tetratricopeptide (TPR) repeat protein